MDARDREKQLRDEGFIQLYVWQDPPNVFYGDHMHPDTTAHIILDGEMPVTCQGETRTYKPGQRFDIPANTVHSVRIGPNGCRYLVGEN